MQLYEVFTFLAERGGIAQIHAENGEIIAKVTMINSSFTFKTFDMFVLYLIKLHCQTKPFDDCISCLIVMCGCSLYKNVLYKVK